MLCCVVFGMGWGGLGMGWVSFIGWAGLRRIGLGCKIKERSKMGEGSNSGSGLGWVGVD